MVVRLGMMGLGWVWWGLTIASEGTGERRGVCRIPPGSRFGSLQGCDIDRSRIDRCQPVVSIVSDMQLGFEGRSYLL